MKAYSIKLTKFGLFEFNLDFILQDKTRQSKRVLFGKKVCPFGNFNREVKIGFGPITANESQLVKNEINNQKLILLENRQNGLTG